MRHTIQHVNGAMREITVHTHDLTELTCDSTQNGDVMMIRIHDQEDHTLTVFLPRRLAVELHQALDGMLTDADILAAKVT